MAKTVKSLFTALAHLENPLNINFNEPEPQNSYSSRNQSQSQIYHSKPHSHHSNSAPVSRTSETSKPRRRSKSDRSVQRGRKLSSRSNTIIELQEPTPSPSPSASLPPLPDYAVPPATQSRVRSYEKAYSEPELRNSTSVRGPTTPSDPGYSSHGDIQYRGSMDSKVPSHRSAVTRTVGEERWDGPRDREEGNVDSEGGSEGLKLGLVKRHIVEIVHYNLPESEMALKVETTKDEEETIPLDEMLREIEKLDTRNRAASDPGEPSHHRHSTHADHAHHHRRHHTMNEPGQPLTRSESINQNHQDFNHRFPHLNIPASNSPVSIPDLIISSPAEPEFAIHLDDERQGLLEQSNQLYTSLDPSRLESETTEICEKAQLIASVQQSLDQLYSLIQHGQFHEASTQIKKQQDIISRHLDLEIEQSDYIHRLQEENVGLKSELESCKCKFKNLRKKDPLKECRDEMRSSLSSTPLGIGLNRLGDDEVGRLLDERCDLMKMVTGMQEQIHDQDDLDGDSRPRDHIEQFEGDDQIRNENGIRSGLTEFESVVAELKDELLLREKELEKLYSQVKYFKLMEEEWAQSSEVKERQLAELEEFKNEEIERAESEAIELRKRIDEDSKQLENYHRREKELLKTMEHLKTEISKLEEQIQQDNENSQTRNFDSRVPELEAQVEDLKRKLEFDKQEITHERKTLDQELSKVTTECDHLRKSLNDLTTQLEHRLSESESSELKKSISKLKIRNEKLEDQNQELQTNLEIQTLKTNQLCSTLSALRNQVSDTQRSIETYKSEIQSLSDRLQDKETEIEELKSKITQSEKEHEFVTDQLKTQLSRSVNERNDLRESVKTLHFRYETQMKSDIGRYENEKQELENEIVRLKGSLERVKSDAEIENQRDEKSGEKIASLEQQVKEFVDLIQHLESKLVNEKKKLDVANMDLRKRYVELAKEKEDHEKAESRGKQFENDLEVLKRQNDEMREMIKIAEQKREKAKKELTENVELLNRFRIGNQVMENLSQKETELLGKALNVLEERYGVGGIES